MARIIITIYVRNNTYIIFLHISSAKFPFFNKKKKMLLLDSEETYHSRSIKSDSQHHSRRRNFDSISITVERRQNGIKGTDEFKGETETRYLPPLEHDLFFCSTFLKERKERKE